MGGRGGSWAGVEVLDAHRWTDRRTETRLLTLLSLSEVSLLSLAFIRSLSAKEMLGIKQRSTWERGSISCHGEAKTWVTAACSKSVFSKTGPSSLGNDRIDPSLFKTKETFH